MNLSALLRSLETAEDFRSLAKRLLSLRDDDAPVETLSAILREEPAADPALADLPLEFERILRRSLQKRREDRYESAADLAIDLRRLAADGAGLTKRRAESRRRQGLGSTLRTWLRPSGRSRRSS